MAGEQKKTPVPYLYDAAALVLMLCVLCVASLCGFCSGMLTPTIT